VLAKLSHQPAGLRLIRELVQAPEQGRSLRLSQERRQGRHDVLDDSEGSLAQTNRGEIAEGRRKVGAERLDLGANDRFAKRLIARSPLSCVPAAAKLGAVHAGDDH
jgi:hypothetical protein